MGNRGGQSLGAEVEGMLPRIVVEAVASVAFVEAAWLAERLGECLCVVPEAKSHYLDKVLCLLLSAGHLVTQVTVLAQGPLLEQSQIAGQAADCSAKPAAVAALAAESVCPVVLWSLDSLMTWQDRSRGHLLFHHACPLSVAAACWDQGLSTHT